MAEKRRDEETKAILHEWSEARGRMEAEIQRKKEHLNVATNFEKARGFVRSNWKSKNFNPNDDPTKLDSSTDESDVAAEERDEADDKVEGIQDDLVLRAQTSVKATPKKSMSAFVDITQADYESHKGTTERQLATLAAIQEYNKSLPKARRAKDSLPEIATSNIAATYIIKKDLKKGTSEEITKYHQVGIEDGGRFSQSADKYSLSAKQSAI